MILVKKIEIIEFRGIRQLEVDFKKSNFAICGKNGTGKSGIVDALEFALTGNISRLSGSGTGGISLKEHAPHVDCRKDPSKSKVIITIHIPSLNKDVTIERCVNDIPNPIIKPQTPEISQILEQVTRHPEFTLSRRELIKYVISAPGDRAKEIQALLRLEQIETLRAVLQKIANADKREIAPLKKLKEDTKAALLTALGIGEAKIADILIAVNLRRKELGLVALTEFSETTSFNEGLAKHTAEKPVNISKQGSLADLGSLTQALEVYASATKPETLKDITTRVETLNNDKVSIRLLTREEFIQNAIQLIEDDHCPVCDTELGIEELKAILKRKLEKFEAVSVKRKALVKEIEPYCDLITNVLNGIRAVKEYAKLLKPPIDTTQLDLFSQSLQTKLTKLKAFIPLDDLIDSLKTFGTVPEPVKELIQTIETAIKAIPEPSKQDAARDYLIIAQEKLESYRSASKGHKAAVDKEAISLKVLETYNKVVTQTLENLYKDVEANFTELYRFINADDEAAFTAQLTPSSGKLGFNVDFYGRGHFPPGAYHSEGHQDGMGLCLYLALMKHILGENFTFAVLDDVLMSVDSGHRREVCKMLKEKFPKTQFILTTHDEVWLKHMRTAGLIQGSGAMQFRKWDVDHGPNEWNTKDVWQEIEDYLTKNDVRAAAALLRHYLEYLSADICHKWHAKVEFRGDGQYVLGDLLPQATSQLNSLYGDGIKAANQWGKTDLEKKLSADRAAIKELISTSQAEQWQTNVSIHYNEWANLDKKDFEPVATSYKSLTEAFSCPDCKSILYLAYDKSVRDSLRCSCGSVNINLRGK